MKSASVLSRKLRRLDPHLPFSRSGGEVSKSFGNDAWGSTAPQPGPRAEITARVESLRRRIESLGTQRADSFSFLERVEGEIGVFLRARRRYRQSHQHGISTIGDAYRASSTVTAAIALDEALLPVDLSRALYLDTETTGLSQGAGTLAFLVGLGRFDQADYEVEQLVLPRPGEEIALLEYLAARLAEASCVISYNGKSFDWPLLKTRFVMNRMAVPELPCHLDLLHCARRIFRPRLSGACLGVIEEEVLGFQRRDDIHGASIPARYQAYLRGAGESVLGAVLAHNRDDIVSLPALLGELGRRYLLEAAESFPEDQLALASVALRSSDFEAASRLAQAASTAGRCARRGYACQSEIARKQRRFAQAVSLLLKALGATGAEPPSSALHLALAKLYEHRLRDFDAALDHAERATAAESRDDAKRRRRRLKRKRAMR